MTFARRFAQRKTAALCLVTLLSVLYLSCGKHDIHNSPEPTGKVTFYNESRYHITIHHSHFGGSILVDKLAPGNIYSIELNPSNNYGAGDVFSIRYWYMVADNVWTNGADIDPNMQIAQNIEAGKHYIIQIPNPSKLELSEAFVKILNTSKMPIEFNYLSNFFKQVGNGELHVQSGETGIYSFTNGTEIKGYTITQVLERYPFPELIIENGYVYNFEFNGEEVRQSEATKL
ncbi:MAG: hypothetical protein FWH22_06210 [Fibromonadales bacterium]|nr:hypothetical protein [Fibromonadales bacterium]